MKISIIAALDEKKGIGKGNDLLFKIPRDFQRMKQLTMGHPIIMGRKTFESIGRVLPGRKNIIITRDKNYTVEGGVVVGSLEEALEKCRMYHDENETFIFGGGQIFSEALQRGLVDRLYLTLVKGDFQADTFFPDYSEFKKIISEEAYVEDGHEFTFVTLER